MPSTRLKPMASVRNGQGRQPAQLERGGDRRRCRRAIDGQRARALARIERDVGEIGGQLAAGELHGQGRRADLQLVRDDLVGLEVEAGVDCRQPAEVDLRLAPAATAAAGRRARGREIRRHVREPSSTGPPRSTASPPKDTLPVPMPLDLSSVKAALSKEKESLASATLPSIEKACKPPPDPIGWPIQASRLRSEGVERLILPCRARRGRPCRRRRHRPASTVAFSDHLARLAADERPHVGRRRRHRSARRARSSPPLAETGEDSDLKEAVRLMSSISSAVLSPPTVPASPRPVTLPLSSETLPLASRWSVSAWVVAPLVLKATSRPARAGHRHRDPGELHQAGEVEPVHLDRAADRRRIALGRDRQRSRSRRAVDRHLADLRIEPAIGDCDVEAEILERHLADQDRIGGDVDIGVELCQRRQVDRRASAPLVVPTTTRGRAREGRRVDRVGRKPHADARPRPVGRDDRAAGEAVAAEVDRELIDLGLSCRSTCHLGLDRKLAIGRCVRKVDVEQAGEIAQRSTAGFGGAGEERIAAHRRPLDGDVGDVAGKAQVHRQGAELVGVGQGADGQVELLGRALPGEAALDRTTRLRRRRSDRQVDRGHRCRGAVAVVAGSRCCRPRCGSCRSRAGRASSEPHPPVKPPARPRRPGRSHPVSI